jgi:tetratricopeptide (TPR) repeat protein
MNNRNREATRIPSPGSILLLALWATCALGLCAPWLAASAQTKARRAARTQATPVDERTILRIQELLQRNDREAAKAALDEALKVHSGDAGLENLRGVLAAQSGDSAAAEQAFLAAIAHSPRFANAHLNLGRLYQERASMDAQAGAKALKTYQQLLRFQPENAEANYQAAILLQRAGKFAPSLVSLQRLPVEYQSGPNVLGLLCGAYAGIKDRTNADKTAEKLAMHPEFSEADASPILPILIDNNRSDLALKLLEVLESRGLASAESVHRLGLLYEQVDRYGDAIRILLKITPPTPRTLIDLARIEFRREDYKASLGYLAHARDLAPENPHIHYLFGQTCIRMELIAEAHRSFVRAAELEPNNAEYNYAAGSAAAYLRDPSEALPYFQKYLQLKPGDQQGRLMLGAVYFKNRDYPAARRELQGALTDRRTAPNAHYYLGRIARLEGKLEVAVAELGRALELDPKYASALAELGQCRLQKREYPQAEKTLQEALAIDPDNYTANFNLLTLYSRTKDPREAKQAQRFEIIKERRSEKEQDFLRAIETRPQ